MKVIRNEGNPKSTLTEGCDYPKSEILKNYLSPIFVAPVLI